MVIRALHKTANYCAGNVLALFKGVGLGPFIAILKLEPLTLVSIAAFWNNRYSHWDNGKEHGNYYLGSKISTHALGVPVLLCRFYVFVLCIKSYLRNL